MSIFGIIKTVASKGSSYIDEQIEKEKRKSIERADERQRLREIKQEAYDRAYKAAAERTAIREGAKHGRELARQRIIRETQPTRTIQAPTVQSYGFGAPNWEGYNKMFAFPTQQQPKRTKSKRKPKLVGYGMFGQPIYK